MALAMIMFTLSFRMEHFGLKLRASAKASDSDIDTAEALKRSALLLFTVFGGMKALGWPSHYVSPFAFTIFVIGPNLILLLNQFIASFHKQRKTEYNLTHVILLLVFYFYGISMKLKCMENQSILYAILWLLVMYYEAYFSVTQNKSAYIFSMSAGTYALSYYINKHPQMFFSFFSSLIEFK